MKMEMSWSGERIIRSMSNEEKNTAVTQLIETQLASSDKRPYSGLYKIKYFTIFDNGRLELRSSPGTGTEVTVYLLLKEII